MKITVRIPVVVCRDGSWSAWGHCDSDGKGDVDVSVLYDGFDQPEGDLRQSIITAEIDLGEFFKDVTIEGVASDA